MKSVVTITDLQQVFPCRQRRGVLCSRVSHLRHGPQRHHRLQRVLAGHRRDEQRQPGGEAELGLQVRDYLEAGSENHLRSTKLDKNFKCEGHSETRTAHYLNSFDCESSKAVEFLNWQNKIIFYERNQSIYWDEYWGLPVDGVTGKTSVHFTE